MAASYHVRIGGKEHGPFTGPQLKKLVQKGQVTEEAEIRQGDGDKWYPATKVAGLFDGGSTTSKPKGKTSQSGSTSSPDSAARKSASGKAALGKSPKSSEAKRTRKKAKKRPAKAVVDATDVFELDADDDGGFDDVEFVDGEDDFDEDEDVFEDDFEDVPVRSKSRSSSPGGRRRKKSRGTSWNQVRVGLLLIAISVCLLTGSFALQALAELIAWLTLASGNIPSATTGKMLDMMMKGMVYIAPLGNVTAIVGCSLAIFSPNTNGAKGLAIAGVVTFSLHTVTHFMYVLAPVIDSGRTRGFGFGFSIRGAEVDFIVTWFPLFAALIVTSILLWALANIQGDYSLARSCMSNVWIIGAFVVIYVVGYIVGQVWEPKPTSRTTAKALIWMFVLLRLGHLSVYGVYLGRLIPQTFATRNAL